MASKHFGHHHMPAFVLGDLTLIRPLGLRGIPSVLVTTERHDIAIASHYVTDHLVVPGFADDGDARATLEALLGAGEAALSRWGQRTPLLYGSDKHLSFIHTHRADLTRVFALTLNDDSPASALLDKERFASLAARLGIRSPRTVPADQDLAGLRFPVIVKPRRKTSYHELKTELFGGTGKARVFENEAELDHCEAFTRHRDEVIVQEFVRTTTDHLHSFHGYADRHGDLLACFCGKKLRTFPHLMGESSFIELVESPELLDYGAALVKTLGLRGPFKIDLVQDESGREWVLEVNARFTLWNYLGAVHGVNLPAVAYDYLSSLDSDPDHDHVWSDEPPRSEYAPSYRWLNSYRDYHAFRDAHARGELSTMGWLGSLLAGKNVYESFAWRDPMPFAAWLADVVRRKIS